MLPTVSGHIRRLHLCESGLPWTYPIVEKSPEFCAEVEKLGYGVLEELPGDRWGHYNYLILSRGETYLAAIY